MRRKYEQKFNRRTVRTNIGFARKNKILAEQFYTLTDLDIPTINRIIEILNMKIIIKPELLAEQLMKMLDDQVSCMYYILENYPMFRYDLERRELLVKNIEHSRIRYFANLLQYDFIYSDKELVKVMLEQNHGLIYPRNYDEITRKLIENIASNPKFYKDGSKNSYLKLSFGLKDLKKTPIFLDLIEKCEGIENPNWYTYIATCSNELEDFDIVNAKYALPKVIAKKVELNQKLLEVDNLENEEEKLNTFKTLINNIYEISNENLENNEHFSYLEKHLFEDTETFANIHDVYVELFIDENSPCKEESEIYQELFMISDIDIRGMLCQVFKTPLAKYITVDFIKKQRNCNCERVEQNLDNLAKKHQALDYIKQKYPKEEYVPKELAEYLNQNPNLTREELLKLREKLRKEKQQNNEPVVNSKLQEKTTDNTKNNIIEKVKKLGERIFNK